MSPTVRGLLDEAGRQLAAAGVEAARLDARLLLAAAMETSPERLVGEPDAAPSAAARERFAAGVARRIAREPVSRILGRREFWSLAFGIGPATLDPRPDSETLVSAALARVADRNARLSLLDLGSGSGCLLLALLSELPNARGLGVDLAPAAVAVATRNADALGLAGRARFLVGDWDRGIGGRFDLVVSNPPYISRSAIAALAPEVALHEPRLALDGGADGLDGHRAVADALRRRLAPDGLALVEIGAEQADMAPVIYAARGLVPIGCEKDLAGMPRVLILRRKTRKKTVGNGGSTV